MTNRSPAPACTLSQPRIAATVPSARTTQCLPSAPGCPPAIPYGGTRRWLASVVTVIGSSSRSARRPPSPPAQRPAPPLPRRIA